MEAITGKRAGYEKRHFGGFAVLAFLLVAWGRSGSAALPVVGGYGEDIAGRPAFSTPADDKQMEGSPSRRGNLQISIFGGTTDLGLSEYKADCGNAGSVGAMGYGLEAGRALSDRWTMGLKYSGLLAAMDSPEERDALEARGIESPSMGVDALLLGVSYEGGNRSGVHVRAMLFAGGARASLTTVQASTIVYDPDLVVTTTPLTRGGYRMVNNLTNASVTYQGTAMTLEEGGELIVPVIGGLELFLELGYRWAYFRKMKTIAGEDYNGDKIADVPKGTVYRSARQFDIRSDPAVVFDFSGFKCNLGMRYKQ